MKVQPAGMGSAMVRGREGLSRAGVAMNTAAVDIASATAEVLSRGASPTAEPAVRVDLERSMVSLTRAEHAYAASARVVRVSDEAIDSFIDLFARGGRRD